MRLYVEKNDLHGVFFSYISICINGEKRTNNQNLFYHQVGLQIQGIALL